MESTKISYTKYNTRKVIDFTNNNDAERECKKFVKKSSCKKKKKKMRSEMFSVFI